MYRGTHQEMIKFKTLKQPPINPPPFVKAVSCGYGQWNITVNTEHPEWIETIEGNYDPALDPREFIDILGFEKVFDWQES